MNRTQILVLLVAVTAVYGVVDARQMEQHVQYSGWEVLATLMFSFLSFCWYRLDSEARMYRRTALLNVGIVMFAILAVPYYLVRSRPAGQKGRALLRLAGFCALLVVAAGIGGVAYELLA
jgi:CDP-diglyceride synthetase